MIIEKKVLKVDIDDHSWIITKPDSGYYDDRILVVFQDAYGDYGAEMMSKERLSDKLSFRQYDEVMKWLDKPSDVLVIDRSNG